MLNESVTDPNSPYYVDPTGATRDFLSGLHFFLDRGFISEVGLLPDVGGEFVDTLAVLAHVVKVCNEGGETVRQLLFRRLARATLDLLSTKYDASHGRQIVSDWLDAYAEAMCSD